MRKEESQEEVNYGYYSKLLNRPFDTLDELREAEDSFRKEQEAKENAVAIKKARAKEVEDAYVHYTEVKEKAYKEMAQAEQEYLKLRNKFAEDYGGYHMTYTNANGNKTVTFGDILDFMFR